MKEIIVIFVIQLLRIPFAESLVSIQKKNYNASESLVRNIILNSNNSNNVFFKQVYKD